MRATRALIHMAEHATGRCDCNLNAGQAEEPNGNDSVNSPGSRVDRRTESGAAVD
jgi:hypothetical protein